MPFSVYSTPSQDHPHVAAFLTISSTWNPRWLLCAAELALLTFRQHKDATWAKCNYSINFYINIRPCRLAAIWDSSSSARLTFSFCAVCSTPRLLIFAMALVSLPDEYCRILYSFTLRSEYSLEKV